MQHRNQFRALQQFFRWLAEEEQLPDPTTRLRAPKVNEKLVPVFTSEELSALEKTCRGRSFAQRRDTAIIAVLTATGIRAGELAGDPLRPARPAAQRLGLVAAGDHGARQGRPGAGGPDRA